MTSEDATEVGFIEMPESQQTVDDQLIDELVGRAQAKGLQLTGEGGTAAADQATATAPADHAVMRLARRGLPHRGRQ
ncbi:hypothetical protein [Streptomyces sp. 769]|uniref:hypothetical protein n=1 Tax=Streptomyces sp. 769 TaxID=1262452 RepID=UPI00068965C4|nr:hypothetical protein [Streptomyces sp. 769]